MITTVVTRIDWHEAEEDDMPELWDEVLVAVDDGLAFRHGMEVTSAVWGLWLVDNKNTKDFLDVRMERTWLDAAADTPLDGKVVYWARLPIPPGEMK